MSDESPWSMRIGAGPKNTENIELKMTLKCVFIFRNPATFLKFSLNVPFMYLETFNAFGR